MTLLVLYKLLALLATIALGWWAVRQGWLAPQRDGGDDAADRRRLTDPAQVLGNATLYLFVPALLFRTLVRQDLSALPLHTLAAYFVPALLYMLAVYGWHRLAQRRAGAEPATRAIAATYGNAVQLGIPMSAALFGEPGLALHIALVSLHGLVLLTVLTVLVEADLARGQPGANRWATLKRTLRNTVIHPVVLPVLAGLAWNLTGLGLHPIADQMLQTLGQAVVPLSLVLIGASLAAHTAPGQPSSGALAMVQQAAGVAALKLLVLPALVLLVAHGVFGLSGTPLSVLVMMAALPAGTNALIFAQRYQTLQAEAAVAVVVTTSLFMGSAALWLSVLGWLA